MLYLRLWTDIFYLYMHLYYNCIYIYNCNLYYNCIYTFINLMHIYFVFTAIFMGIGLNSTNKHLFWLLLYSFFCKNSKLCNTYENVNVFSLSILSYYTYSGTEYSERQFYHYS